MRRQKLKKITAKLFLAIFVINAICIVNFTSPASAVGEELNLEIDDYVIYEGESVTIQWIATDLPNEGDWSYGAYVSKIYMRKDNGDWQYKGKRTGLGDLSKSITINDVGIYIFKVKEYATLKSMWDGVLHMIPGNWLVATEESDSVTVRAHPPPQPYLNIDKYEINEGESITLTWNIVPKPLYDGYYAEIYYGYYDKDVWEFRARKNMNELSHTMRMDTFGTFKFKVDIYANMSYETGTLEYGKYFISTAKDYIPVSVSQNNFTSSFFDFDDDIIGLQPTGWEHSQISNTDSYYIKVIDSSDTNLENLNQNEKLLKIHNTHYAQSISRDFFVEDLCNSDDFLHIKFDIATSNNYNHDAKFQILLSDNNARRLEIFLCGPNLYFKDADPYAQDEIIYRDLEENRIYSFELIFSFKRDLDCSANTNVLCQSYINGIFNGYHSLTVINWRFSDDICKITLGHSHCSPGSSTTNFFLDNLDYTIIEREEGEAKKYAIIVGISDYNAMNDLECSDEDATDWYNHLTELDYYCQVYGDGHLNNYPIHNGFATEDNVRKAIQTFALLARPGDTVVIISSGHGGRDTYLCMWDYVSLPQQGAYHDTELASDISKFDIGVNIFIFISHCFSGGMGPELMALSNKDHIYCTTTCTEDGYGYQDPYLMNSEWTYSFLEYGWQGEYEGNPHQSMESIFECSHINFNKTEVDQPQEFDGNLNEEFYLA